MAHQMNRLIAELWQQLVEVENVVGEVVVAAAADPVGLAVTSPVERRHTVPRID